MNEGMVKGKAVSWIGYYSLWTLSDVGLIREEGSAWNLGLERVRFSPIAPVNGAYVVISAVFTSV